MHGPDHRPVPAADLVDPTQTVWSLGTTLHWGDGHTTDLGTPAAQLVVAGAGVYVLTDDGADVLLATPDGRVEKTGESAYRLVASPDGHYLAFIDWRSGEKGRDGERRMAVAVVLDLVEGEDVLRTADDLGVTADDDLGQLYEGAGDTVVEALTDEAAWIRHPGGVLRVDLATGEHEQVGDDPADLPRGRTGTREANPAGTWAFDRTAANPLLLPARGRPVEPQLRARFWSAGHWLDDRHLLLLATSAWAVQLPDRSDQEVTAWSCAVPSGRCSRVPGAAATLGTYADSQDVPPAQG